MEENNGYDNDGDRLARGLKRKGLDIHAFEINSGRRRLKRSLEELHLATTPVDEDYITFLKSLLLKTEPNSPHKESDDEDDMDPEYSLFLENLSEDGLSYKLEIAMENRVVSVMYEGEDDSDDDCGMPDRITLTNVLNKKNVENEDYRNISNDRGLVRSKGVEETNPKAANFIGNSRSRDEMRTRSSPRLCSNLLDSTKSRKNKTEGQAQNFLKRNFKSEAVKDMKNLSRRKEVGSSNILRNGVRKLVEHTRLDTEGNGGGEKEKSEEERDLKSKSTNGNQTKTNEYDGKIFGAKWNSIFGCDWQHELNADDVDECYRTFLNSVKIEGDCIVYAFEGENLVKHEALDIECSSDSEVLETPENEQVRLRSRGGGIDSVFRKQLMARLGEPYDDGEYKKLWNEINEEKPKIKHYDLRGSRAAKSFRREDLSPSYLDTFGCLKSEIAAFGQDQRKTLNYLRGFFFWLQNVVHDDAFKPWLDGSCLEAMRKGC